MAGGWSVEDMMDMPLRTAVSIHMTSRCYPPIPAYMLDTLVEACQACQAGDYYQEIALPDGTTYRGQSTATAEQIVEGHRLNDIAYTDLEDE